MAAMTTISNEGLSEVEDMKLNDADSDLEVQVRELLWSFRVLGNGTDKFGLRWVYGSADELKYRTGGWLLQTDPTCLRKGSSKGKLCFVILNDEEQTLRQCKDESATYTYRTLSYSQVGSVSAQISPDSGFTFLRISMKSSQGSKKSKSQPDWLLMPIQNSSNIGEQNEAIVVRWAAALRQRCGLVGDALLDGESRSIKAATWMQSKVRMRAAIEKAERRRERREGIVNKLGGMVYGYEDSEDEEEEKDSGVTALGRRKSEEAQQSSFLVTFITAVAADMLGIEEERPKKGGKMRTTAKRMSKILRGRRSLFRPTGALLKNEHSSGDDIEFKHSESFVQDASVRAPLEPHEIEDELWENERWTPKSGWAQRSLLPSDRSPFSDRIGRGSYKVLDDLKVPEGWEVSRDWELDLSGQVGGRCGPDGWIYGINFPPTDSALAKGAPQIHKGVRSVVRRRRHFRRRVPEHLEDRLSAFVIWHGWLGKKVESTGRWVSRYFVLTRGLRLHGRVTGVALSHFRASFVDHLNVIGSNDLELWNSLSSRDLKTFTCDGAHILHKASHKHSKASTFQLGIGSQVAPLHLCAESPDTRDIWVQAIEHAIKDQVNRFTLTKSLNLNTQCGFIDAPQYQNSVLDRLVPMPVDKLFLMLFFNVDFEDRLEKACNFELVESTITHKDSDIPKHMWSLGQKKGSRREQLFITPNKNNRKAGREHETIFKQKVMRCDAGEGYQVDMSIQKPTGAYGNISTNEVRIVLFNWQEKNSRVVVTHRTKIRTEDESVKVFVESTGRRAIVKLFSEIWLPLVQDTLKQRRAKEQQKRNNQQVLASATGIQYTKSNDGIKAEGYLY